MVILVTGATGSIGRHLVPELLRRGEPVRAFVRDEAKGAALGCPLAVGDLDDPASIAAALDGVDRVFLNASGAGPADGEQPMVRQQLAVLDAARAAGVRHVVKISVLGAHEHGRLAGGAHWRIEQHLRGSGLDWSILRPNGFMQNFVTGAGAFVDGGDLIGAYGDGRVAYVDCADIAAVGAALLAVPVPGIHEVSGPDAVTHTEVAAAISRATGRTVRYVDLPPDAFACRLVAQGLPAAFADDVATLFAEVAGGGLAGVTDTVLRLTGRPPRGLDDFLAAHRDRLSRVFG